MNAEGQGYFYDSKAQAVAAVLGMQKQGIRSIDVGCMQISLLHHPDAFPSLEQAFDPAANADYGGRFLSQLHDQSNSWPRAVEMYHSATPDIGEEYGRRVYAALPEEQRLAGLMPTTGLESVRRTASVGEFSATTLSATFIRSPFSADLRRVRPRNRAAVNGQSETAPDAPGFAFGERPSSGVRSRSLARRCCRARFLARRPALSQVGDQVIRVLQPEWIRTIGPANPAPPVRYKAGVGPPAFKSAPERADSKEIERFANRYVALAVTTA